MHSRAHHSKDPVFAGMRALRMKKQGDKVAHKCAQCHSPRDPDDFTSAAALAGVSCATCHNLKAVDPTAKGAAGLTWDERGTLTGPHDLAAQASPAHPTGPAPAWMKDGVTLCLTCHGEMKNANGAPTCTTGPELAQSSGQATCVSCHMPRVQGPAGAVGEREDHASHAFLGPHRAWYQRDASFLASGVELSGRWDEGALVVTLKNASGHAFPSGFPGRVALLKVTGFGEDGQVAWSAWSADPMKEAPELVLNKVYVDGEGKPTLPPFAQRLKRDSRLKPDEARQIKLSPPAQVKRADVALLYRLVPGPAVGPLGLEGEPEAQPRKLKSITVERP
jgi:mono/diheme cytochrome c family protein